jgi:Cu+-exporting ATPase
MAKADTIVLDKTGTLTIGKPEIVKFKKFKDFDENILYSLVKPSKHPIAKSIVNYFDCKDMHEFIFDEYEQSSAHGIIASIDNNRYIGGNKNLLKKYNIEFEYETNNSIFYFCKNSELLAVYELEDSIKENALEIINSLKKKNIDIIMLSGDNQQSVDKVANKLKIDNYFYEQTPQDKANFITKLHNKEKTVVMVGDGINDILALARADIGIAMGNGNDIAIEVGDVVLLNDSLSSLDDAVKISKTTFGLIKQNLAISLVYNAITIPLAMAGYVIPLVAAISMSVSSLLVVGNSMRIKSNWKK